MPTEFTFKYSKISVNGFQVGSDAEVIRKPTNNVDRAKIVLRDKITLPTVVYL